MHVPCAPHHVSAGAVAGSGTGPRSGQPCRAHAFCQQPPRLQGGRRPALRGRSVLAGLASGRRCFSEAVPRGDSHRETGEGPWAAETPLSRDRAWPARPLSCRPVCDGGGARGCRAPREQDGREPLRPPALVQLVLPTSPALWPLCDSLGPSALSDSRAHPCWGVPRGACQRVWAASRGCSCG